MPLKLNPDKPWAKLRLTRAAYEAARPWKRARMSRAAFEKLLLALPDDVISEMRDHATAEALVEAMGLDLG